MGRSMQIILGYLRTLEQASTDKYRPHNPDRLLCRANFWGWGKMVIGISAMPTPDPNRGSSARTTIILEGVTAHFRSPELAKGSAADVLRRMPLDNVYPIRPKQMPVERLPRSLVKTARYRTSRTSRNQGYISV